MLISYNGNRSSKVDLHVRVPQEYSVIGKSNLTQSETNARRQEGYKNVDLWVDPNLYPPDPATQYPPSFHNLPSFLQFVGDGDNGLLGYCNRLSMQNSNLAQHFSSQSLSMQYNLEQKQKTIQLLEAQISETQSQNEKLKQLLAKHQHTIVNMKSTPVGIRERKRPLAHIETLAVGGGARKRRIRAARSAPRFCTKTLRGCVKH